MIRQQDDWAVENLLNKYKPMICGMIFRLGQFENCSVSGDAYKEDLEPVSYTHLDVYKRQGTI